MRKLREAAVVVTMGGGVGMIGAGVASAHGHDWTPPSVSIKCAQDTGDNTLTTQGAATTANVSDALNGGDAQANATQQLCGLNNEDATNTGGTATGGPGGVLTGPLL